MKPRKKNLKKRSWHLRQSKRFFKSAFIKNVKLIHRNKAGEKKRSKKLVKKSTSFLSKKIVSEDMCVENVDKCIEVSI